MINTSSPFLKDRRPWLVLAVGLLITFGATLLVKFGVERIAAIELDAQCDEIQATIMVGLGDYARLLQGGVAFFYHSEEITRKEWQLYCSALDELDQQLPGIQGTGFSLLIPPQEPSRHLRELRGEGFPEYAVKPAGQRTVYSSIIYLEPLSGPNLQELGYDMFSEPVRRKAMEQARDTDRATLSGKTVLVQKNGADVQDGALMYLPVYRTGLPHATVAQRRAALKGWVYASYRMGDMIRGILGRQGEGKQHSYLQLFDGGEQSPQNLLYESHSGEKKKHLHPVRLTRQIQANGRLWTLTVTQTGGGYFSATYLVTWFTLAGGVAISLLLFGWVRSLQNTSTRAEALARTMTRELHKSEEKVCLILDTIGDAVCGIELNGCCTFCNPAALLVLGYGRQEELLGKNLRELVHHSYGDGSPIPLESCSFFKSFTENQSYRVDDELFRRSDGSSFPVEYCSAPQLTEGRITGAVVTFMDITARKELQEKLRLKDQAKMDSITRLAAGVAHELNSPLGFISSNLRVLTDYFDQIVRYDRFRRDLDAGDSGSANRDVVAARRAELEIDSILDDGADLIGSTLGGATRVTKIVQDLQNYTRDTRLNPPEKEALTLDSCLDNALTVCLTDLNYVATIRKEYEPTPTVLGNRGQMNQLFLNLLLNAGQAMVAPGEIVLKSRFDERFVYVSVSDTGAGIPEKIMNRIFDPFFTTKDVGKGTGLGLSISSEIIKKHDGELQVESVVGVGTTFTVKLPWIPVA